MKSAIKSAVTACVIAGVALALAACEAAIDQLGPAAGEPNVEYASGCVPTEAVSISATGDDGNIPANVADGDLATRWSHEGKGSWIQFDLGEQRDICGVTIAWFRGDERVNHFTISVSSDGERFSPLYSGESSGETLQAEDYWFAAQAGRYVRVTVNGNTMNDWASVTELTVLGTADPSDSDADCAVTTPDSISAIGDDGNVPVNVTDSDLATRWSHEGKGSWIQFDLREQKGICGVTIAWYRGDERVNHFTISVSSDGETFTPLYSGDSSGETLQAEDYWFAAQAGRYVRVTVYGNTQNLWASITELQVFSGDGESPQSAETSGGIYLSPSEISAIKARAAAGEQPWKRAFDDMKAEADEALGQAPLSVTFQGRTSHDYFTMRPYDWSNNMPSPCGSRYCDGEINPMADRADYRVAIQVGAAVRALGLGYAFTGEAKYADKAITLIRAWCLDPATYMTPKIFARQAIEQFITFPGMFYGADLIWDYPGWSSTEREQLSQWVKDFAQHASTLSYRNNWESWRQVLVASAGGLIGDSTLTSHAFDRFKSKLSSQIGADGRMTKELRRTLSLFYSLYALNAMTQVAEIARHQGVDLYSYTANGRNLELAWDFHVPYLLKPSSWPWAQIKPLTGDGIALYELAYTRKQKSGYLEVINKYGRPLYEIRVMGPTTLTHSHRP